MRLLGTFSEAPGNRGDRSSTVPERNQKLLYNPVSLHCGLITYSLGGLSNTLQELALPYRGLAERL